MRTKKVPNGLPAGVVIRPSRRRDEGLPLIELLDDAFPEIFEGRTFYKQQPHHRLLAFAHERLVGHIGIDLRAITIGDKVHEILGISDLCVLPEMRGQSVGSALIDAAERVGVGRDFAILFADDHRIYETNGCHLIEPALTRWLAIDDLRSHSVIKRDLMTASWPKLKAAACGLPGRLIFSGISFEVSRPAFASV